MRDALDSAEVQGRARSVLVGRYSDERHIEHFTGRELLSFAKLLVKSDKPVLRKPVPVCKTLWTTVKSTGLARWPRRRQGRQRRAAVVSVGIS